MTARKEVAEYFDSGAFSLCANLCAMRTKFARWLDDRLRYREKGQLALKLNVLPGSVSRWCSGATKPSDEHLKGIAEWTKTDVEYLRELLRTPDDATVAPEIQKDLKDRAAEEISVQGASPVTTAGLDSQSFGRAFLSEGEGMTDQQILGMALARYLGGDMQAAAQAMESVEAIRRGLQRASSGGRDPASRKR